MTRKARIKFGLLDKFQQVLNDWAGREAIKISITETIDEMGNIIDKSETETTFYTLIGNQGMSTNEQPIGALQPGDLCMYAKVSDDIVAFSQLTPTTTRRDEIRYEDLTYRPELTNKVYDVDEEVLHVFKLKRLSV